MNTPDQTPPDNATIETALLFKCEKHGVNKVALCSNCYEFRAAVIKPMTPPDRDKATVNRLHAVPHIALSAGEEERYRAAEARFNESLNAPHFICRRCRRMTSDLHHICVPYGEGANWEERAGRWLVIGCGALFIGTVLYLYLT